MHRNYSTHQRPKGSDSKKRHDFLVGALRRTFPKMFYSKYLRRLLMAFECRLFAVLRGNPR